MLCPKCHKWESTAIEDYYNPDWKATCQICRQKSSGSEILDFAGKYRSVLPTAPKEKEYREAKRVVKAYQKARKDLRAINKTFTNINLHEANEKLDEFDAWVQLQLSTALDNMNQAIIDVLLATGGYNVVDKSFCYK
jgi:hypothetical protein